jgi:hypothetical protein
MANRKISVIGFDSANQLLSTNTYGVGGQSRLHSVYGLAYHPYNGCIGLRLHTNVEEDSSAVFVDNPSIPIPLEQTEVVVFNPVSGCYTHYKKDGSIVVLSPTNITESSTNKTVTTENLVLNAESVTLDCDTLTINSPVITINSNVLINGSLKVIDLLGNTKIDTTV